MASNRGNTRNFETILYPEDKKHMALFEKLKELDEVTYILHDKDTDTETGEIKKPHYHVLWRYPMQRSVKSVSEETGLPEHSIEKVREYNYALIYLIHANTPEKYPYDQTDVQGSKAGLASFQKALKQFRNTETSEDERILAIVDLITNWDGTLSFTRLIKECCAKGWYADLRRGGYLFRQIVFEHNMKYEQERIEREQHEISVRKKEQLRLLEKKNVLAGFIPVSQYHGEIPFDTGQPVAETITIEPAQVTTVSQQDTADSLVDDELPFY